MGKKTWQYTKTIKVFKQKRSVRNFIYHGKTMKLLKHLLYSRKKYDTIPKTIEF